jgi:negative regulator of flagellin synthesis FlgM
MVESIRPATARTGDLRVGKVANVTSTTMTGTNATQAPAAPATLAQSMAASAPVDMAHVERIKQAIAEGNYPLSPATVADSLIAARYEWMSDDQA